jgi:hypothetical protein
MSGLPSLGCQVSEMDKQEMRFRPIRILCDRESGSHTPEIIIGCMACSRRLGSNEADKTF